MSKKSLEEKLLKTKFVEEAKCIPLDEVTPSEKKILSKCINKEEFNDEEFASLKLILKDYRPFINKYKDLEENITVASELIESEQSLLNLLDDRKENELFVNMNINGKDVKLKFIVNPITDSRVVLNLEAQLNIFNDFTEKEQAIYNKGSTDKPMSKKEQNIYNKLVKRVNENTTDKQVKMVNTLLAAQLRLPNQDLKYKDRLKMWKRFPFMEKMLIFMRVQDQLGITDIDQEKLFRPFK